MLDEDLTTKFFLLEAECGKICFQRWWDLPQVRLLSLYFCKCVWFVKVEKIFVLQHLANRTDEIPNIKHVAQFSISVDNKRGRNKMNNSWLKQKKKKRKKNVYELWTVGIILMKLIK